MLRGKIDAVNWETDPVQLNVRDDGAWLLNMFIKNLRNYATVAGVPMQDVMQQIINDNPPQNGAVLFVQDDPQFNLLLFTQQRVTLMQALSDLALDVGFDIRYRYGSDGVSRLTLLDPPRDKTVSDFVIGPKEYGSVQQLRIDDADVRNYIRIIYASTETGGIGVEVATNAASIEQFGERFYEILQSFSSNINTQAEAAQLAAAILNDLGEPNADQQITTLFCYPIQLYDLITFEANYKHYDVDQQFAVLGYTHTLANGSGTTQIKTRGQPAGAFKKWLNRFGINTIALYGVPSPTITVVGVGSPDGGFNLDGRVWVTITFEPNTEEVFIYSETGPNLPVPTPDESDITRNYIVRRPPGTTSSQPFYNISVPIATTNGWYRTIKAFGVGYDGQRSVPVIATVQAGTPGQGATSLPGFQAFSGTRVGDDCVLVWALDLTNVPADAVIVITRDAQAITGVGLDQTATTATDTAPSTTVPTLYQIYLFEPDGTTGPASTFSLDAANSGGNAGQEPMFKPGTPNLFDYGTIEPAIGTGQLVVIEWTCADTSADQIAVEYSLDGLTWYQLWISNVGYAGNVASGAMVSNQTGRCYYRLTTFQAGALRQHSVVTQWAPAQFPTQPVGGGDVLATIVQLLRPTGLLAAVSTPKVFLQWRNPDTAGPVVIIQYADALAGPWITLATFGYGTPWSYLDGAHYHTPQYYRVATETSLGAVRLISNVVTWYPLTISGFTGGAYSPDSTPAA